MKKDFNQNKAEKWFADLGEHWRTKKEINDIFKRAGYVNNLFHLKGDLCIKKPSFFRKIGWIYYYSLLDR